MSADRPVLRVKPRPPAAPKANAALRPPRAAATGADARPSEPRRAPPRFSPPRAAPPPPMPAAQTPPPSPSAPRRWELGAELRLTAHAWQVLTEGRRWSEVIEARAKGGALPSRSRAAVQDYLYLLARHRLSLEKLASFLNQRQPAPSVGTLQLAALALLTRLEADDPYCATIVDQAVRAAKGAQDDTVLAAASGFINATLRRFLRERADLMNRLQQMAQHDPCLRWNFPQWWIDQIRTDYPQQWQEVLEAMNQPAHLTLRVNPRQTGRAEFVQSVAAAYADAGLKFITPDNTLAVMLDRSLDVTHLPGYEQGHFSVQDLAAQHAAPLLAPAPGASILDACAAPGGKTAHLLELADVQVTAIDQDERRLERLGVNLSRLQLDTLPEAGGQIIAGDAANLEAWWDGVPFDHVLLDAPCSASGIVRRHPDVRWLRKRSDLATLAEQQSRLLDALWPVLKPGGTLLYITCSVFRAEGAAVIDQFLARTPEAKPLPMRTGCLEFSAERALLPSADHDGFYFCLLQRQPVQE